MRNKHRYLSNKSDNKLVSALVEAIEKLQPKAHPRQWIATINALTQKGIKGTEIAESGVIEWLEPQLDSANSSVTKDDLLRQIKRNMGTVKEIDLGRAEFSPHSHGSRYPGSVYVETLYCLNSERDDFKDRLDEIRYELEDLDFNPHLLLSNPAIVLQLSMERKQLMTAFKTAADFKQHHYSDVRDENGDPYKNLIAHARTSILNGNHFLIEEIQSDWAQRGRANEWNTIPKGKFVTNTETWSGLVLRRLLQRAAENPAIKTISWITGDFRNGRTPTINENGDVTSGGYDGLNEFYLKVLPKLADKVLKGTGEKIKFMPVKLRTGGPDYKLPGFEMTDTARVKLMEAQPLYSRDLLKSSMSIAELGSALDSANTYLRTAEEMLGNTASIRFASQVFDAATGQEVAGKQIGRLIELSLRAGNPERVFHHEAFHYACENLLDEEQSNSVERAFANGSRLNMWTREALVRQNMHEAVAQCDDPREAAAHAFSLWQSNDFGFKENLFEGELTAIDRAAQKAFQYVEKAIGGFTSWMKRVFGERPVTRDTRVAEEVFSDLASGRLAAENAAAPRGVQDVWEAPEIQYTDRPKRHAQRGG